MRDRLTTAICSVIVAAPGTGCVDLCEGAKELGENTRFTATLVASYLEGGDYLYDARYPRRKHLAWESCDAIDGLRPGVILQMRSVGRIDYSPSCLALVISVDSGPTELTLIDSMPSSPAPGGLTARYFASIGGCQGTWTLWFERTIDASIFSPPIPGEPPIVLATREFEPLSTDAGENDCRPCSDAFVVHLEKKR